MNLACLMDGRFPDAEDEIAIDRMHADNVGVEVGDRITVSGKPFKSSDCLRMSIMLHFMKKVRILCLML